MKVKLQRDAFLSSVQLASAAIPAREIKPILNNFKIIASMDGCTLLATDLELGIRIDPSGVQVIKPGETLLPALRTHAILRESFDEIMYIETNEMTSLIRGGNNEFEIVRWDPEAFPDVPTFTDTKYYEIESGTLREMIRRTIFAVADENIRYAINGVLWEPSDNYIRLVATDGRRLAVADGPTVAVGTHETDGTTHVVPTKAAQLLEKNLQGYDGKVLVNLRANDALFKTDKATVYTRLVEGRFPPYRNVFPKKQTSKIKMRVGSLYSAVRQAAIMADKGSQKVTFTFANKALTLQAQGTDTGRAKVEMPLEHEGTNIEINLDPVFMTEMLRVLPSDSTITAELVDGNNVALFRHDDNYSYIVMPMT